MDGKLNPSMTILFVNCNYLFLFVFGTLEAKSLFSLLYLSSVDMRLLSCGFG